MQLPDGAQARGRHRVLVRGQQLLQVEVPRDLFQYEFGVRRQRLGRDRRRRRRHLVDGHDRRHRVPEGVDEGGAVVVVGEGVLGVVIVLEEVEDEPEERVRTIRDLFCICTLQITMSADPDKPRKPINGYPANRVTICR